MSRPLPPAIAVYSGGWQRTFAPGRDVVIGRDVRADVRIPHPGVSRVHVVLRYLDGHWVAIDNQSLNGIFVGHQRVPSVDIRGGETIHIGNPDGPRLAFELGPVPRPDNQLTTRMRQEAGRRTDVVSISTTVRRVRRTGASVAAPPGSTTVGRAPDNDVVIPDALASGHHATLMPMPEGCRSRTPAAPMGTFVNGQRVKNAAAEAERRRHDRQRRLCLRERQSRPSHRTREQDRWPRGVRHQLDHRTQTARGWTVVSFSAKPATLTAVIGPSGSGKSTLLKVIAGGTRPASGAVFVRSARRPRRVRVDAHPDRHGSARRPSCIVSSPSTKRWATPAESADATGHHQGRSAARGRAGARGTRVDAARDTRVDKLSGGQRKRASVALELLTGPSLLVLDEPTTGLDPALDQLVMKMLRQLADAGRVVVVVTHSLAYLDVCDQVLLLWSRRQDRILWTAR